MAASGTWSSAIDSRPDGRRHVLRPSGVRYPAAWLNWRLRFWRGPDGKPLPPPRMQAAVRRLDERRERELHLAAEEQRAGTGMIACTRASGADPALHAGRLRERMGWTVAIQGPPGDVAAAGGRSGGAAHPAGAGKRALRAAGRRGQRPAAQAGRLPLCPAARAPRQWPALTGRW
jgi:hypothetical protein